MFKKLLITLAGFALACCAVIGMGALAGPGTGIHAISPDSPCPATSCASGECHGFDSVPEPDGVHEMSCPEASCASVECHAWDTMLSGYRQASDASLNVWVLAPVALVVALVAMIGALSRTGSESRKPEPESGEGNGTAGSKGEEPEDER